jgi:hypothetical protein
MSISGGDYQFYGNLSYTFFAIVPEITFNYGNLVNGILCFHDMFSAGFTLGSKPQTW